MSTIQIKTVKSLNVKTDLIEKEKKNIYTFLTRYPTASDSDQNGFIYAYKPEGWPELVQPQYKNAPCHILAKKGSWTRLHWSTLNKYTYTSQDWRQRLYYTHWKPMSFEYNGYVFDPVADYDLLAPEGLDWNTYDWTEIRAVVADAQRLIDDGVNADRQEIQKIHIKLKQLLDCDDIFYLNRWVPFCRNIITLDM